MSTDGLLTKLSVALSLGVILVSCLEGCLKR